MSLGRLLRNLQSSVSTFKCEGGCSDLPTKCQRHVKRPGINKNISSWRETRRYPVIFFDQAAIGNAQRLVADLKKHLSNMCVLTSIQSPWRTNRLGLARDACCPVRMLIDHPFILYLSLMDQTRDSICVFPFTPCLSCIVERGCLTRVYEHLKETMPSTGLLRLAAPGGTVEEMSWETLQPGHSQETSTVSR